MNPRSRPLVVLLVAALAVSARAVGFDEERRDLLADRNPKAAEAFLKDAALQADLRAQNESGYFELLRAATELKDLDELMRGYQDEDRILRGGLAARPNCSFCQDVPTLEAWCARWGATPGKSNLSSALYDWGELADDRVKWLKARGITEGSWARTRFVDRQAKIAAWATAKLDAMLKENPGNAAQMDSLRERSDALMDALTHDQAVALGEFRDRTQASVDGLAQAEKKLARSADPALLARLKAARAAPTLDARLAALSQIFDGLGEHDAAVSASAPAAAGQGFDDSTRRLAADELGPSLLATLGDTNAGKSLRDFYAKHALKIAIEHRDSGIIASYSGGTLTFGEDQIEDFLKARGKSAKDLTKDAALLSELSRQLAPVFVHEATHHEQDEWAKEQGIRDSWSQYGEIEAMQAEALFVLQKARLDPSYKDYLEKTAKESPNAKESLALATRLEESGPSMFRASIRAWHYPEKLSLEGETWRRLAKDQAAAARPGPKAAAALADERAEAVAYAKHRARFEAANAETERLLRELGALAPARRIEVPPPGHGGLR